MYGYLSQTTYARCTVPTLPEVVQSTHSSSSVTHLPLTTINAHKYSFFVRTVPAWNALSPVSVSADSVAVFHSSICKNVMF